MRLSVFVSVWVLGVSLLVAGTNGLRAQSADLHRGAFQEIIKAQIKAFATGDAEAAFSLESSELQRKFQTPAIFIEAVKNGFRPVYRARNLSFGLSKTTSKGPVQEVYVTDEGGETWLALYSFAQHEDGTWRISGCYLAKSEDTAA